MNVSGPFNIVEFVSDRSIAVVPDTWIESSVNETSGKLVYTSYWPPSKVKSDKLKIFTKKKSLPDKENWQQYRIRIIKSYGTYDEAQSHLTLAEVTSNVESDNDREREKKQRKERKRKVPTATVINVEHNNYESGELDSSADEESLHVEIPGHGLVSFSGTDPPHSSQQHPSQSSQSSNLHPSQSATLQSSQSTTPSHQSTTPSHQSISQRHPHSNPHQSSSDRPNPQNECQSRSRFDPSRSSSNEVTSHRVNRYSLNSVQNRNQRRSRSRSDRSRSRSNAVSHRESRSGLSSAQNHSHADNQSSSERLTNQNHLRPSRSRSNRSRSRSNQSRSRSNRSRSRSNALSHRESQSFLSSAQYRSHADKSSFERLTNQSHLHQSRSRLDRSRSRSNDASHRENLSGLNSGQNHSQADNRRRSRSRSDRSQPRSNAVSHRERRSGLSSAQNRSHTDNRRRSRSRSDRSRSRSNAVIHHERRSGLSTAQNRSHTDNQSSVERLTNQNHLRRSRSLSSNLSRNSNLSGIQIQNCSTPKVTVGEEIPRLRSNIAFEQIVLKKLEQILQNIDIIVKSKVGLVESEEISNKQYPVTLPCENVEELVELNAFIREDQNGRKKLLNRLSVIGGDGTRNQVRRILTDLISDNLALLFNWQGKGTKIGFKGNKHLLDIIIESVRRNRDSKHALRSTIEDAIKRWFRFAKDRCGGRKGRRNV